MLALTLNAGGYLAESYRAGFQAVPPGQHEAAAALGMPEALIFWRVTLPQAIRIILPSVGNTIAGLLLTTPFVFLVGLEDMMAKAVQVMNRTADWSVFVLVTLIYTVLGLILVGVNAWLEHRFKPLT
jgi:polar amino acid transport system permease protein